MLKVKAFVYVQDEHYENGDDYKCAVDWMRDEIGIDLEEKEND